MNSSSTVSSNYFEGKPELEAGVRRLDSEEKFNNYLVDWVPVPGVIKENLIEVARLKMWLVKIGMDGRLGGSLDHVVDDITSAVNRWYEGLGGHTWGKVQLNSKGFEDNYQPQLLYYKLCKDGKRVKLAINIGKKVGEGSFINTFAIPVVTVDADGKIQVKSKALRFHKEKNNLKELQFQIDKLAEGSRIQQRALMVFKEMKWGEPTIAPVPKELYHGSGLSSQSFYPVNLRDVVTNKLMFMEQLLQVLEDVALAVAALDKVGASHFDVRPMNIMITKEGRGRLIDFNCVEKYKNVKETVDHRFPYRGQLWKKKRYCVVTKGADICGLARTILESCFKVPWDQSHEGLFDDKYYNEVSRNLNMVELKILEVAKKMLLADKEFFNRMVASSKLNLVDVEAIANDIFQDCDALWCAQELKKIRLEILRSSQNRSANTLKNKKYSNWSNLSGCCRFGHFSL